MIRYGLALCLLSALTSPGRADLRLERQRSIQDLDQNGEVHREDDQVEVIFIGETSARYDTGSESFIVRADDGRFLWLDHETRRYAELPIPLRMEELFTDQEKECVRSFPQALVDAEATVMLTNERRTIGRWKARRIRVEGHHKSGVEFNDDSWLSHDLPIDVSPYHLLVRNRAALSPATRGWIEEVLAAGGFPVESTTTVRIRGHQHVDLKRLQSVEVVEAEPSRYLPPRGYSPTARPPIDVTCVSGSP